MYVCQKTKASLTPTVKTKCLLLRIGSFPNLCNAFLVQNTHARQISWTVLQVVSVLQKALISIRVSNRQHKQSIFCLLKEIMSMDSSAFKLSCWLMGTKDRPVASKISNMFWRAGFDQEKQVTEAKSHSPSIMWATSYPVLQLCTDCFS